MISPQEYEALSVSTQRKYFSSIERLRIIRHSAAEKRKKNRHNESWLSSSSSNANLPAKPKSSSGLRRRCSHPLRSRQGSISEEDARWYLALPDKIKRQQFSRDEQTLFTARCESVLKSSPNHPVLESVEREGATDGLKGNDRPTTAGGPASPESRVDKISDFLDTGAVSPTTIRRAADVETDILPLYLERGSTARMDNVVPPVPPLPEDFPRLPLHERKSFSRTRAPALTPLPLPAPKLAPWPTDQSSETASHSAISPKTLRPFMEPTHSIQSSSPEAKDHHHRHHHHYHREPHRPKRPHTSHGKSDEFLDHAFGPNNLSVPSFFSTARSSRVRQQPPSMSSGDMDGESFETLGPTTPPPASLDSLNPSLRQASSFDSGIDLPLQVNRSSSTIAKRSLPESFGSRDTTSPLSLFFSCSSEPCATSDDRPSCSDHRIPSCSDYRKPSSSVELDEDDPLALEALPVCDDDTGAHGAFAVNIRKKSNSSTNNNHNNHRVDEATPTPAPMPKALKWVWKSIRRF